MNAAPHTYKFVQVLVFHGRHIIHINRYVQILCPILDVHAAPHTYKFVQVLVFHGRHIIHIIRYVQILCPILDVHAAPHCNTRVLLPRPCINIGMCCSVLQCVAVCCSVLQRVAVCCSVSLQHEPPVVNIVETHSPHVSLHRPSTKIGVVNLEIPGVFT